MTNLINSRFKEVRKLIALFLLLFSALIISAQAGSVQLVDYDQVTVAAAQVDTYLPLLENKRVGVVANPASMVYDIHLVDTLISRGVQLSTIFSPEHGFRGTVEAGELIENGIDQKTGLKVISLYGSNKKPEQKQLEDIDIILFDLQDVGVRFYTYISTLTYVMEAAAESGIPMIVLDRPNPNGYYIDGPVLGPDHVSFVGMHPVPVVYGMTIGEYAQMVNGEGWMENDAKCELTVIPLKNYTHNLIVKLPIKPSPNLPNWESVYLYPSLCFLEGTIVSIGRGTAHPFQIYGHPDFTIGSFAFRPESMPGYSLHPKLEDQQCYGQNLNGYAANLDNNLHQLNLSWLLSAYEILHSENDFFTPYFETLAGTDKLRQQIESGLTEEAIRESWIGEIEFFKKIRANYLLYD